MKVNAHSYVVRVRVTILVLHAPLAPPRRTYRAQTLYCLESKVVQSEKRKEVRKKKSHRKEEKKEEEERRTKLTGFTKPLPSRSFVLL